MLLKSKGQEYMVQSIKTGSQYEKTKAMSLCNTKLTPIGLQKRKKKLRS